jgi:hypothetical protein
MVSFVILWFVYPYQESLYVNTKGMDLTQIILEKTREVKVISIGLLIMKEKKSLNVNLQFRMAVRYISSLQE